MRNVLVAVLALGCSASMVNPPGGATGSPNAPVNEAARPGLVKYLNQGAGSVIAARREDAYKQMHSACRGSYRIDAEGPRAEGGMVVPVGEGAVWSSTEYWYIQFSCAPSVAAVR